MRPPQSPPARPVRRRPPARPLLALLVGLAFALPAQGGPMGEGMIERDVPPGQSTELVMDHEGLLEYHDHATGVLGTIEVIAAGSQGPRTHEVRFDGDAFRPGDFQVRAGDTVRFVNDAAEALRFMGTLEAAGHGPGDAHGELDEGAESPGVGLPLVVLALAALLGAVARRR